MSRYVVYLEKAEEGGFVVSCPHFSGCVTQGETVEEALDMIKDAIKGCIVSATQHGEPIAPGISEVIEKIEVVEV